ncbi:pentapeptide repeat-containing protein [Synechocystis sp. LEGE 06083]|uniref:pentapeptide repeat-containing protein n=1 Tax=Synechocystis sp. LEGE 06083 TaxID=915336 RepID=UPI00187FC7B0|nr:pentapeptide repeat-containing protein [Synechocystis sp. LEGE 06083]MBE9194420.1 pentapeptide repeat-containing protein [Synechocystis sp. LEGE 06083]
MTDFQQQPRPDDAVLGGTQTGAQSKISREKAIKLLQSGETGKKAWNQFITREYIYPILDGIDLQGQKMSDLEFTKVSLRNVNVAESLITKCDFSSANLRGACFKNCKLDRVDFQKANLEGADFSGSVIRYCNFSNADLRGCKFCNVTMEKSNFSSANMTSIIMKNTSIFFATPSYETMSYLQGLILCKKVNEEKNYNDFKLTPEEQKQVVKNNSSFCSAILLNADLSSDKDNQTVLICCNFDKANLTNANFNGSNLRYACLQGAIVDNTNFLATNLEGADLSETDFYLANVDASTNTNKAIGL